jgi:hypothetical protein
MENLSSNLSQQQEFIHVSLNFLEFKGDKKVILQTRKHIFSVKEWLRIISEKSIGDVLDITEFQANPLTNRSFEWVFDNCELAPHPTQLAILSFVFNTKIKKAKPNSISDLSVQMPSFGFNELCLEKIKYWSLFLQIANLRFPTSSKISLTYGNL